jgi:hypothetical protein
MRRNGFGETYCHDAREARQMIEAHPNGWNVYAGELSAAEDGVGATAEILDNVSGELVCYVEAKTTKAVLAILNELKIDRVHG